MDSLFEVTTDRIYLIWGELRKKETPILSGFKNSLGTLRLRKRRENLVFQRVWRSSAPEGIRSSPDVQIGPLLFEETDYSVWASTKTGSKVSIMHRDPVIIRNLEFQENGKIHHGPINFGSQVGLSEFNVLVDGRPEFDFTVEVFPSKLDYTSDYEELLQEVQDVLTGLALEYLRSTYKLGFWSEVPQPTHVEWLTLLKNIATDLERALNYISQYPIRSLVRQPVIVRIENVKRVDSAIRAAVFRGSGSGEFIEFGLGLKAKRLLVERQARSTLDTPEHRWLNAQINRIRQRLVCLRQEVMISKETERRLKVLSELAELEARITRLRQLEPLASAVGDPPPEFTSLKLQGTPGYREAYKNCLILLLGLRIEGGPLQLSVKDLHLLYEYWCYLSLLRIISEETNQPIDPKKIIAIKRQGLQVLIQKGRESSIPFSLSTGQKITVFYNPQFHGDTILVPQQPDMLMSFQHTDWPTMHFILDAKYRVDTSTDYVKQYGSPGPPNDALNVLHRYRDAILEQDGPLNEDSTPKRTVVQGAALFPFREKNRDEFLSSRLWQGLQRIGIGAVPFLPGEDRYITEWLRETLRQGGWTLSDRAIPHRSEERSREWRLAASEIVLIGILRGGEKADEERHFSWIRREKRYYIPLRRTQQRFHVTKWVAIYQPRALRQPGAITHWAEVKGITVVPRREIATPWPPRHELDQLQVLYHLGELLELPAPIENRSLEGLGEAFRGHRWTSRLALVRAKQFEELFLETEPEWRLYEDLKAARISFNLVPGKPKVPDSEDPTGRAFFMTEKARVQYRGGAGFLVNCLLLDRDLYYSRTKDVIAALEEFEFAKSRNLIVKLTL